MKIEIDFFHNAPDWARWHAFDADGIGYRFGEKPSKAQFHWSGFPIENSDFNILGIDWENSLVERTE